MNEAGRLKTPGARAWDERYDKDSFHYGVDPNDFLRANTSRIKPGGRILCLAEGEGRNAIHLAKQGFRVTAVDQSAVGLRKLSDWASRDGLDIETILCDLSEYDPGVGQWDAVVSIWCHLPPELRRMVHERVKHALVPGGMVILEAYHPRQLEFKTGGPPLANLMMTVSILKSEFDGLDFEVMEEVVREVQEGEGHFGQSAVVRMLGRKSG